jgi:hypothetical protein
LCARPSPSFHSDGTLFAHQQTVGIAQDELRFPKLLMPDQQLEAQTAGDHDYRIKHLPLE